MNPKLRCFYIGALGSKKTHAKRVGRLKEAGLAAAPVLVPGDPKYALPGEASRWEADAIFLGAKGHSALQRFLLGSVSAAVAARALCSVEVVRPPAPAKTAAPA